MSHQVKALSEQPNEKPSDLSSIPEIHMVEGENGLLQLVL